MEYANGDKKYFETIIKPYTCFIGIYIAIKWLILFYHRVRLGEIAEDKKWNENWGSQGVDLPVACVQRMKTAMVVIQITVPTTPNVKIENAPLKWNFPAVMPVKWIAKKDYWTKSSHMVLLCL